MIKYFNVFSIFGFIIQVNCPTRYLVKSFIEESNFPNISYFIMFRMRWRWWKNRTAWPWWTQDCEVCHSWQRVTSGSEPLLWTVWRAHESANTIDSQTLHPAVHANDAAHPQIETSSHLNRSVFTFFRTKHTYWNRSSGALRLCSNLMCRQMTHSILITV